MISLPVIQIYRLMKNSKLNIVKFNRYFIIYEGPKGEICTNKYFIDYKIYDYCKKDITNCIDYARYKKIYRLLYGV